MEDSLDRAPEARQEKKYREKRKEDAREPEPSRDKWEEESEADAEGAADRRGPVKESKDPAEAPATRKGRSAGKPPAPGTPAKEPAPGREPETKKKGEAPEASRKSAEPDAGRSRGREDGPQAEKKRAGSSLRTTFMSLKDPVSDPRVSIPTLFDPPIWKLQLLTSMILVRRNSIPKLPFRIL